MIQPVSKRLTYRNYSTADRELFIDLVTDQKVMKYVGDGPLDGDAADKLWSKMMFEFYPSGQDTLWAVIAKEDRRYIGHSSIRPRPGYPDQWEIGYILRVDEWGSGYGTEIATELVRFGFEALSLEAVYATVDDDHKVSHRVLEKAGFNFFGYDYDESGRYSVFRSTKK
jgi:RimJ/RimL family protein N-acetyltransferase